MRRAIPFLPLALLALVSSCSTVPPRTVSVEARGAVYSSDVFEAILLVFGGGNSDPTSTSTKGGSGNGSNYYNSYSWSNENHESYGLRAALSSDVFDIVVGVDEHWFDDRGSRELSIGLRKRFDKNSESSGSYAQILARHGEDIRTDSGQQDYDGFSIGIGKIVPIDDHWFFDVSLEFESTWNTLRIEGDDSNLFSVMVNVGLGYSI